MKRFSEDFDKKFKKTQKLAIAATVINAVFGIGMVGFVIWAVVKLMSHFNII